MPVIVRNLPFYEKRSFVEIRDERIAIKPYQVILWASVAHKGTDELHPLTPRFPVVVDTAFNNNFLIKEDQLARWAGVDQRSLPTFGRIHPWGQEVPILAANIWLHANVPGERSTYDKQPAFCVNLEAGIGVAPTGTKITPRLPVLGLRALRAADLHLSIDCRRCRVSIRTPRRFWFF